MTTPSLAVFPCGALLVAADDTAGTLCHPISIHSVYITNASNAHSNLGQ